MSLEKILKQIEGKIDKELSLFDDELEIIMKRVAKLVEARALSTDNPLNFDIEVQRILQEAGYYSLVNRLIDESYDKTYKELLSAFSAAGIDVSFDANDLESIRSLKELDLRFFEQIGATAADTLKRDLFKYSLSNMDDADLLENISMSLEGTELKKYSKTYAETMIAKFNQAVINRQASKTTEGVWIYVGVEDRKTRPYCQCLLDQRKFYNDSDKISIENDSRRAYNCRHTILKVTEDYAKAQGYTSGSKSC